MITGPASKIYEIRDILRRNCASSFFSSLLSRI